MNACPCCFNPTELEVCEDCQKIIKSETGLTITSEEEYYDVYKFSVEPKQSSLIRRKVQMLNYSN